MGLFTKFKMLFNKSVALQPYQKNDVVSFVKLKKGMLKIGADLQVDENYNLVSVYYNKVCDVLGPGEYKADEVSLPKLFRYSKAYFSKKGFFTPKTVTTDLYYVCTRAFTHYQFNTPEKIIAKNGDKKVKIKLEGTFTMKIISAEKLLTALCNDYAVVHNKQAIKDITSAIGYKISKVLNSKQYSLADYLSNKEKIAETLNLEINQHIEKYGLTAQDFFVNSVILPKKLKNEKSSIKNQNVDVDNSDIVKIVEERLNNMEKDLSMVYAESASNATSQQKENISNQAEETINAGSQKNNSEENIFIIDDDTQIKAKKNNKQNYTNSFSGVDSSSNWQSSSKTSYTDFNFSTSNQPEPIIIEEIKPADPPQPMPEGNLDDDFIDGVIDKIEKRKKQKKRERLAEILSQADVTFGQEKSSVVLNIKPTKKCSSCGASLNMDAKFCSKCGKSTEELKICPCCGAKNFPTADACCVCKSVLD